MGRRARARAADAGRAPVRARRPAGRRRSRSRTRGARCAGALPAVPEPRRRRAAPPRRRRARRRRCRSASACGSSCRGGAAVLRGVDLDVRAGRARGADGPQRRGQVDAAAARRRACWRRRAARCARGRVALLLQNPGDYLAPRARRRRAARRRPGRGRARRARRPPPARPLGRRAPAARAGDRARHGEPPAVVCLDEPTRGMDRGAQGRARRAACASWPRPGPPCVVATHDAEFAATFADRTVLLGRRPAGRRRADRRGAGRRLVLRHPDGAHPGRGAGGALLPRATGARSCCARSREFARTSEEVPMSWVLASSCCSASRSPPASPGTSARTRARTCSPSWPRWPRSRRSAASPSRRCPASSRRPTSCCSPATSLGGAPGFAVGAVAALASNLFFGQGPWTPWQMIGWGGAGLLGAGLARVAGRELGRIALAAACAVAGPAVRRRDEPLALGHVLGRPLVGEARAGVRRPRSPFDVAHALGNVVFCLAFGPALVRALRRYRTRFEVTWRPGPAAAGVAVALAALLVALPARGGGGRAGQGRALPGARAERRRRHGTRAGRALDPAPHGLGRARARRGGARPRATVSRGGRDLVDYIRAHASELRGDPGERSRTILALRAAGAAPGRLGGRNLVAELLRSQERNGSFAGRVNTTAFAVLALRAAGRRPGDRAVRRAAAFLQRQANRDGGYNFAGRGGPSGADDTGSALQGLAAAGKRRSRAGRRAAAWLVRHQNADGGFSLQGGASNAQSTAWAVQGLIAAGRNPARLHRARRALAAGLPALADRPERRRPLLAHQRPDPGVGHGAGPDRPRRQGAADRSGAALSARERRERPAARIGCRVRADRCPEGDGAGRAAGGARA